MWNCSVSVSVVQDKHGPEFMPMAEWTRTPLHQVPGTTATSILPRILSYVERVGCSEAKGGAEVTDNLDCPFCHMLTSKAYGVLFWHMLSNHAQHLVPHSYAHRSAWEVGSVFGCFLRRFDYRH